MVFILYLYLYVCGDAHTYITKALKIASKLFNSDFSGFIMG